MLRTLIELFRGYELYEVVLELAVIWAVVYLVFRFLRGTRGAGIIKGVAVLLVVLTLLIQVLGQASDAFGRLSFIYDRFLGLLAVLLIVVFQPELRQAMIQLGRARWFRASERQTQHVVEAVASAAEFLSKNQFGALIAIERDVKLGGLIEGGENLDAVVSARLLQSIFWPNSPLHDLGVVIRGDRIVAANVQFPLAEEGVVSSHLGSRHRAASGLTLESDCLAVIVSEERGEISLAERGRIEQNIPREVFREVLAERLASPLPEEPEQPEEATAADEEAAAVEESSEEPAARSTVVVKEA